VVTMGVFCYGASNCPEDANHSRAARHERSPNLDPDCRKEPPAALPDASEENQAIPDNGSAARCENPERAADQLLEATGAIERATGPGLLVGGPLMFGTAYPVTRGFTDRSKGSR
jgi:hypothetical protein